MIIRKPYAFLIKNFRKIHVVLLILSLFVAYKLFRVSQFVNEFMRVGTYDLFRNPITNYITTPLLLSLVLLVAGSLALMFLLMHKQKPWKLYLIPAVEYFILFLVLNMIKSFFRGYSADVETTDLRLSRDLLMIFITAQIPVIAIYIMRTFGLDFKKFQFNIDKEFLELSEEDREEIEIGLSLDRNSFIRGFKRFKRNFGYFYAEHKGICRAVVIIFIIIVGFQSFKFLFVTNKSYKEGDYYSVDGYTFKINNTYFTDKDSSGNVISDQSNFVIVDLTIHNNSSPRKISLENFHIHNASEDYTTTNQTFSHEFSDLGTTYDSVTELKRDQSLNCIIIYKVSNNLNKNKFVLYYQENGGYLRKIKLKVKDISKINDIEEKQLGDEIEIPLKNNSDTIIFESAIISELTQYSIRNCTTSGCVISKIDLKADDNYRILRIDFSSDVWEAKNMIDFFRIYGKLNYKDSNGETVTLDYDSPISKAYYGKSIFLKVPVEMEDSTDVSLDILVRNKHYVYKLV